MNPSSENNSFTAADIERYHSGKMSVSERHALEKAALDDPFLADALEGYTFTATAADDIQHLKERLNAKTAQKRTAVVIDWPRKLLRVAAVIAVMAGAGWITYQFVLPGNKDLAIQTEKKSQEDKTQQNNLDATVQADSALPEMNSNYLFPEPTIDITTAHRNKESKDIDKALQGKTPGLGVTIENNTNQVYFNQDTGRLNNGSPVTASAETANNRVESEQLVNRNNRAAFEPSANNGTYRSDDVAKYKSRDLPSDKRAQLDSMKSPRISGFIDVNKSDTIRNLDVVLKKSNDPPPEEMLFEKDSAKTASSVARRPFVVIDTLEPAEGYARFDDYIATNLKMPEELRIKPESGVVELLFDVNNNGEPVNITVIKSLCDKCDEEAIRLLKEGPKWKKKKNRKGKISIRFN